MPAVYIVPREATVTPGFPNPTSEIRIPKSFTLLIALCALFMAGAGSYYAPTIERECTKHLLAGTQRDKELVMPRLIIYFPFKSKQALELAMTYKEDSGKTAHLDGKQIENLVLGYEDDKPSVHAGDLLVINAHGSNEDSKIYSQAANGLSRTQNEVIADLAGMGAGNGGAVYFAICFSAKQNHIADTWCAKNGTQPVYGADEVFQGAIVRSTRSSVSGGIFGADTRLRRIKG